MKEVLLYVGGVVTGVIMTIIVAVIISTSGDNSASQNRLIGATMFPEPTEIINEKSVKVLQVVRNDAALVHGRNNYGEYYGTLYLIINDEGEYYYDDQIIKVPQGKVVRQIGVYKYTTKSDTRKTVPIIKVMDE